MPAPHPGGRDERLRSLDGLRGFAALVVVIGHARIVYLANYDHPILHMVGPEQFVRSFGTLGNSAVWLFFVLSGFVLARMNEQGKIADYGRYVLMRLTRLYVPVWGAVALAVLTMLFIPRVSDGLGDWVAGHPEAIDFRAIFLDLTLIGGTGSNVTPLWSLRWEVFFSLLLVAYVAVARRVPPILFAAICIGVSVYGVFLGNMVLQYMPMFGIGVAIQFGWDRLVRLRDRAAGSAWGATAAHAGLLVLVMMQFVPWYLPNIGITGMTAAVIDAAARLISVTGIVVVAALSTSLRWLFANRAALWLGMISYSLYLVHEQVLLAFIYPTQADAIWLAVAVVLSIPVAWGFFRLVERPAHALAKRVGRERQPVTA